MHFCESSLEFALKKSDWLIHCRPPAYTQLLVQGITWSGRFADEAGPPRSGNAHLLKWLRGWRRIFSHSLALSLTDAGSPATAGPEYRSGSQTS
jgi:hypothetical protein